MSETACGRDYEHDWHVHLTPRGKVAICDGAFRHKKAAHRAADPRPTDQIEEGGR